MDKPDLAAANSRRWTHIEVYMEALARRGTERRRRLQARTEPESPRLLLSTVPILATILALAILIATFAIAAWPPSQPEFSPKPQAHELGTAQRGWFQEARKEFR
jgi:hypothetical protein